MELMICYIRTMELMIITTYTVHRNHKLHYTDKKHTVVQKLIFVLLYKADKIHSGLRSLRTHALSLFPVSTPSLSKLHWLLLKCCIWSNTNKQKEKIVSPARANTMAQLRPTMPDPTTATTRFTLRKWDRQHEVWSWLTSKELRLTFGLSRRCGSVGNLLLNFQELHLLLELTKLFLELTVL